MILLAVVSLWELQLGIDCTRWTQTQRLIWFYELLALLIADFFFIKMKKITLKSTVLHVFLKHHITFTWSPFSWPFPFPYSVCCCPLSSVLHLYTIFTGFVDVVDWCLSSAARRSADDESFLSSSWFDELLFALLPVVFERSPGRDIVNCACTVHSAVISAVLLLDILFYPRPTHAIQIMLCIFLTYTRFCVTNNILCTRNHGNKFIFKLCLSVC